MHLDQIVRRAAVRYIYPWRIALTPREQGGVALHTGVDIRLPGRGVPAIVVCLLLASLALFPAPSPGDTFLYDPERDAFIEEVASWTDPGGAGADLLFNLSSDGSMILLRGYGSPNELRVVDLDMGTIAVLPRIELPHEVRGFTWSELDQWIVAWSRPEGGGSDFLQVFDVPSFRPNGSVPWVDAIDLVEIDLLTVVAFDDIVMVAGRDANGTSVLLLVEVEAARVHKRFVWQGNHTIIAACSNGRETVIADSGGNLVMMAGFEWDLQRRYENAFADGPLSWYIPIDMQWVFGDSIGRVVMSHDSPFYNQFNITVGEGPVTGVSWTEGRLWDFMAAFLRPGGGSRLVGWQLIGEGFEGGPLELCHLDVAGNVTMMRPDPRVWGRVLVAFDNGTLSIYRLDVRPRPTYMPPGTPDQVDWPGFEPFRKWRHEDARGEWLRFSFNHRGSLILLQGFASPDDIRVVNRTMDTVAVLEPPHDEFVFSDFAWSANDRWLLAWGMEPEDPVGDRMRLLMYDVPSFDLNTTSSIPGYVLNVTGLIWSAVFLPGDDILAMSCGNLTSEDVIILLDLHDGSVIQETLQASELHYDSLVSDGDNLVVLADYSRASTYSPPDWDVNRSGVDLGNMFQTFDVHNGSGWVVADYDYNLTIFSGSPREMTFRGVTFERPIMGAAWTRTREGDLVLAVHRIMGEGTNLQLWQTVDRPDLPGMRMLAQVNSSKVVVQMAADPAFPGLMAVSFSDGTFALYHLNVTPYPPPPEEISGMDIGPINEWDNGGDTNGTGGDGGDGDRLWGSGMSDLFAVLIAVALAALVAVYVWLRLRMPEDGGSGG